jgi:hypothetical protein
MRGFFHILTFLGLCFLLTAAPNSAAAAEPPTPTGVPPGLLPDLQPLPPYELQLELRYGGVRRLLHFSHAIWNRGAGDLELHGWYDRFSGIVRVRQLLRSAGGSYADSQTGEFVFHNRHEHWHWEGFSRYEILALQPDDTSGPALVSSEKVGFCLRDDERMPAYKAGFPLPASQALRPRARFGDCGWQKQGLSPGWLDIYGYQLDGQSLDVTELEDGIYILRTLVDPADLLLESDESNNSAQVYFGIYGERLVVFGIEPMPASVQDRMDIPKGIN